MAKISYILLTGIVLSTVLSLINGGVIVSGSGKEHDNFFKQLSDAEQKALMAMAVSHFHVPESSNHTGVFPDFPILKPKSEEIPKTLFTTMMNGGVPKKWMKKFMKWLRKDYGLTDQSFYRYASDEQNRLCRGEDDTDCISMDTLQSSCCPFG